MKFETISLNLFFATAFAQDSQSITSNPLDERQSSVPLDQDLIDLAHLVAAGNDAVLVPGQDLNDLANLVGDGKDVILIPDNTALSAFDPSKDSGHGHLRNKKPSNIRDASTSRAPSTLAVAKSYSPSDLPHGQLPSDDPDITFTTYDGNWVREIKLPVSPSDKSKVTVVARASYSSDVTHPALNFETATIGSINLKRGESATFHYDASEHAWKVEAETQTPNGVGDKINNTNGQRFVRYHIYNGNWVENIKLPENLMGLKGIFIMSDAGWESKIDEGKLVTKSTANIRNGDRYVLLPHNKYQKWILHSTPEQFINALDISTGVIPNPVVPNSVVRFGDGNHIQNVALPASGKEGDTVTIRSEATWNANILNDRTDMQGSKQLKNGDEYVFVRRSDNNLWSLYKNPVVHVKAQDIQNGDLQITAPETHVFLPPDVSSPLKLPTSPLDTKVHVTSETVFPVNDALAISVSGDGMTDVIKAGEWVTFVVGDNGWKRETITIDLLALYSHKNVEKIGEPDSRSRLIEGFDLTNEALINSGATFRFRMVGLEKFQSLSTWTSLIDPLSQLRDNQIAQKLRESLKADAIYYEGTEDGCGLAWVRASKYDMVGTGSLNCGTTVMRHELGHNMGLDHGVASPAEANSIAVGYSTESTIMGGNAIPYFSTPHKLSPNTKLPLGFEDQIDGVRAMNAFAPIVAAYYEGSSQHEGPSQYTEEQ